MRRFSRTIVQVEVSPIDDSKVDQVQAVEAVNPHAVDEVTSVHFETLNMDSGIHTLQFDVYDVLGPKASSYSLIYKIGFHFFMCAMLAIVLTLSCGVYLVVIPRIYAYYFLGIQRWKCVILDDNESQLIVSDETIWSFPCFKSRYRLGKQESIIRVSDVMNIKCRVVFGPDEGFSSNWYTIEAESQSGNIIELSSKLHDVDAVSKLCRQIHYFVFARLNPECYRLPSFEELCYS